MFVNTIPTGHPREERAELKRVNNPGLFNVEQGPASRELTYGSMA